MLNHLLEVGRWSSLVEPRFENGVSFVTVPVFISSSLWNVPATAIAVALANRSALASPVV